MKILFMIFGGILIGLPLSLNAIDETKDPYPGCDCLDVNICQNAVCQKNSQVKDCASLSPQDRSSAVFECYRVHMKQCKNWYGFLQTCSADTRTIFN